MKIINSRSGVSMLQYPVKNTCPHENGERIPEDIAMGYKQTEPNMTFAEVSLSEAMKRNLSLKRLEKINRIIDWDKIDRVFQSHYSVGSSKEGADAYPPLML